MKKLATLAMATLIAAGTLTLGVSAHKDFKSWGDVPKTSEKIVLDGKLDDIYKKGLAVDVSTVRETGKKDTVKATGYYLYDDGYIYTCVVVNDTDLIPNDTAKQTGNYWECDGVEIMFDFANDGTALTKWTVWYEGFTKEAATNVTTTETKTTSAKDSYIVEFKTKLPEGIKAGSQIGVNLLVDNMTSEGRVIVRAPQSGNATENELAKYDYIVLSDKTVAADKKDDGTAPKTADPTVITIAAGAVSAAAFIIAKKKRG